MPATISASKVKVKKVTPGSEKLKQGMGFEYSASGLHSVCFNRELASAIGTEAEVTADFLSTVIPAGLSLVENPFGNTTHDYDPANFKQVLKGTASIATYLLDGLPGAPFSGVVQQQIESLTITDPCCGDDDDDPGSGGIPKEGGRVCSRPMYASASSQAPLTFHLRLTDLWGGKGSPIQGTLENGLDHFLIPSKTPGNSVVWLAIPRSEDAAENYKRLSKWRKGTHKFAGFSGILFTSDALKISISLDAEPA